MNVLAIAAIAIIFILLLIYFGIFRIIGMYPVCDT